MKLYVYAGIFFALLAFIYWYSDRQYDAGYTKASVEYEVMLRDAQNTQIAAENEHQNAINAVTQLWLSKEPEIEVKYERIEKEVIKYVNDDKSCNLTYGAAILLNQSAKAKQLQEDIHPAFTEDKELTPSPVTQLETVETCIKWAELYNKQSRQLDTLIDILR